MKEAAERREICSPRREPWVKIIIDPSAAARRNLETIDDHVSPLRGCMVHYVP